MFGGEQRGVRRAHSPDSHDDTQGGWGNYRQGGPPQWAARGGYHQQPYQKRHRGESYMQTYSLEDRISRLGETGSRNIDIGILAKEIDADLLSSGQVEERVKTLTARICRSIVSFPTRIGTYATLIGLISVKHYNVSCQIINILHASYPVYLEAQKWQEALTIIHLLASLVNCKVIRPSALLSQFEFMLESTLEDNIPQARSDYYVYTVLSSLPYVAQELALQPETQENFENIMTTIEKYLEKRSKSHLKVIRVWQSSDSTIQMDYLDSLWVQMKNFRATGWNETFLHRPYNDKESKDIMASSLIPTNSPTFQIPAHSNKYIYPCPKIVFRIFEDDVSEGPKAIPGSDKIERFCIENHIRATIDELSTDPKGCARHLINMHYADQLPIKHLLIETILGELLTLPRPKHQEIFYHTLLYEFARIFHPSKNPEDLKYNYDIVLNEAVKVLYENLDSISVSCFTRLVKWLSFHLNNSEFVYPWQTWQDATCKEKTSPKAVFVQDVLDRCVRLSFHQKILVLVKAHLSDLMPPEVSVVYRPVFVDDPKAGQLEATIKRLIAEKADGPTISETLNIQIDGVELPEGVMLKEEKLAEQLLKIDIFIAVILHLGSKSLTHLSSALGKFKNVIKALTRVPAGQAQLLQTMHSCLEHHPQLQVILVDKLLKAEIVGPVEVCNWIFSESMKPYYCRSYPWELLENTIFRVKQTIEKLEAIRDKPKEDETAAAKEAENKAEGAPQKMADNGDGPEGSRTPTHDDDVEMLPASQTAEAEQEPGPTEEEKQEAAKKERDALDKQIEEARQTYKGILVQVFQLFASTLGEHVQKCGDSQAILSKDDTYYWLTGRMQEVYYNHLETIREIYGQVRSIVDVAQSIGSTIVNLNQ